MKFFSKLVIVAGLLSSSLGFSYAEYIPLVLKAYDAYNSQRSQQDLADEIRNISSEINQAKREIIDVIQRVRADEIYGRIDAHMNNFVLVATDNPELNRHFWNNGNEILGEGLRIINNNQYPYEMRLGTLKLLNIIAPMNGVALRFSSSNVSPAKVAFDRLYLANQMYLDMNPLVDYANYADLSLCTICHFDGSDGQICQFSGHIAEHLLRESFVSAFSNRLGDISNKIFQGIPYRVGQNGNQFHLVINNSGVFATHVLSSNSIDPILSEKARAVNFMVETIKADPLYNEFANYQSMLAKYR